MGLGACTSSQIVVSSAPVREGITVAGEGEVTGVPDMASLQVGVMARANDAAGATTAVNEASQKIVAALRAAGLPDKDMQTRDLSVYEERDMPPMPMPSMDGTGAQPAPQPRIHFVARNTLALTVRDLTLLPNLLAVANQAGANEVYGVNLTIENMEPLEEQARAKAFAQGQAKAQQLAQLGGAKLGRLVAVEVIDHDIGGPRMLAMEAGSMDKSMPAVQAGEIKIRQRVLLHYALD